MNTAKLYEMQTALDRHIERQHSLERVNLVDKKIMALLVEVGELANETRCFKFWSLKGPSEKDIILAEYVDGIHFILSLGITCNLVEAAPKQAVTVKKDIDLTSQFLMIYRTIQAFGAEQNSENYRVMFEEYLILANLLGFSEAEIEKAYVDKNEINYERQKQGY